LTVGGGVRPLFDGGDEVQCARVRGRVAHRDTEHAPPDVARADTHGAIDTVLVDIDEVVPGSIDE
jgi:hypothetical protein